MRKCCHSQSETLVNITTVVVKHEDLLPSNGSARGYSSSRLHRRCSECRTPLPAHLPHGGRQKCHTQHDSPFNMIRQAHL
jgi:hypothetical protein